MTPSWRQPAGSCRWLREGPCARPRRAGVRRRSQRSVVVRAREFRRSGVRGEHGRSSARHSRGGCGSGRPSARGRSRGIRGLLLVVQDDRGGRPNRVRAGRGHTASALSSRWSLKAVGRRAIIGVVAAYLTMLLVEEPEFRSRTCVTSSKSSAANGFPGVTGPHRADSRSGGWVPRATSFTCAAAWPGDETVGGTRWPTRDRDPLRCIAGSSRART